MKKTNGTLVEFRLSFQHGLHKDHISLIEERIASVSSEIGIDINVKVVKKHNQKISLTQEKEIANLFWNKKQSALEIAKQFPCTASTIVRIANKYKPQDVNTRSYKSFNRILTDDIVLIILTDRYKYGFSLKELANRYNVGMTTISSICVGRSWKHVRNRYISLINEP